MRLTIPCLFVTDSALGGLLGNVIWAKLMCMRHSFCLEWCDLWQRKGRIFTTQKENNRIQSRQFFFCCFFFTFFATLFSRLFYFYYFDIIFPFPRCTWCSWLLHKLIQLRADSSRWKYSGALVKQQFILFNNFRIHFVCKIFQAKNSTEKFFTTNRREIGKQNKH